MEKVNKNNNFIYLITILHLFTKSEKSWLEEGPPIEIRWVLDFAIYYEYYLGVFDFKGHQSNVSSVDRVFRQQVTNL